MVLCQTDETLTAVYRSVTGADGGRLWRKREVKIKQWEEDGSLGGSGRCNNISGTVAWEVHAIRAIISR